MKKKFKKKLSRRDFLKASRTVGLGTLALSSGCASLDQMITRQPNSSAADGSEWGPDVSFPEKEFDFVVIGSGAGGGPLACRLALQGFSVGLIEAGDSYPVGKSGDASVDLYSVPALHPLAAEDPRMSWNFWVQHYADPAQQKKDTFNYQPGPGKGILYPRAAAVGGCTAHNAMFTLTPDAKDWDDIAAITKDTSWSSKNMRRYFRKLEKCKFLDKNPNPDDNEVHGWEGWLPTEMSDINLALTDKQLRNILESVLSSNGHEVLKILPEKLKPEQLTKYINQFLDPNAKERFVKKGVFGQRDQGLYSIPKATENGRRMGTRQFILDTIEQTKSRPNGGLKLLTNHLAARLYVEDQGALKKKVVRGVECYVGASLYKADPRSGDPAAEAIRTGQKVGIRARLEVILCGGVFNSPQLLQLSGIGDPDILGQANTVIPLKGVGKNLQDRYEIGVVNQYSERFHAFDDCLPGLPNDPSLVDYYRQIENGTPNKAKYSSNGALVAFLKRSRFVAENDPSDLCIFGTPGAFRGYRPGYSKQAVIPTCFSWVILKGYNENKAGQVNINANRSPFEQPSIQFNYFNQDKDGKDINALADAVKFVRKINDHELIKKDQQYPIENRGFSEVWPPKSATDPNAQMQGEELKNWIKDHAWGHHASCTNKIGADGDAMAVLDSEFRVRGTENLRVVDASSFPNIPGLYIVTPIYMISEKAAEVIISQYGDPIRDGTGG